MDEVGLNLVTSFVADRSSLVQLQNGMAGLTLLRSLIGRIAKVAEYG